MKPTRVWVLLLVLVALSCVGVLEWTAHINIRPFLLKQQPSALALLVAPGCAASAALARTTAGVALRYNALTPYCNSTLGPQLEAELAIGFREQLGLLTSGTGMLEEAYVSFISGEGYAELVTYPLQSIMEFSTKSVVLFISGNLSKPARELWSASLFPRLLVYHMPPSSLHPWFDKLRAAILSPVLHGAIVEGDTLVTWHADRVFAIVKAHGGKFPLLTKHEDSRLQDCYGYNGPKYCGNAFPYPTERRTMDYGHAHMFWKADAKEFLLQVLEACHNKGVHSQLGPLDCTSDESALNYALWNMKATKQLCLMDPNSVLFPVWEAGNWSAVPPDKKMPAPRHLYAFMYLHGAKDSASLQKLLQGIRRVDRHAPWYTIQVCPGGSVVWGNSTELLENFARLENCVL
jgi:hypothetical protein